MVMSRPTIEGSALNRLLQSAWLKTSTRCRPGSPSDSSNARPSTGETPNTRKKFADTCTPRSRSVSASPADNVLLPTIGVLSSMPG